MKTTSDIVTALKIQETSFYKNQLLNPFIYTYLSNQNLCKIKIPFKLLHRYEFGENNSQYYVYKHSYVFIGYRWLSRKFWPLFISVTKYENKDNNFIYDVTGFSTYDTSFWFTHYKDLGFIEDLPVYIPKDIYFKDSNFEMSLFEQIDSMGKKVLKHLMVRQNKLIN